MSSADSVRDQLATIIARQTGRWSPQSVGYGDVVEVPSDDCENAATEILRAFPVLASGFWPAVPVGMTAEKLALTWAEKEAIADEVIAVRAKRFEQSFEIECPECGKPPGACCMNLGSAGGPVNHTARIERAFEVAGIPPNPEQEETR